MAKIQRYSDKKKLIGLPDTTNIADAQTRLYLDRLKQSFDIVVNSLEELRATCITQKDLNGYLDKYMLDTAEPNPDPIPPSPVPPEPDPDSVKLQGIAINPSTMKLYTQGQNTGAFTLSYIPSNVPNRKKGVSWTSSDESAATVDENGNVTAVSQGLAIISAISKYDSDIYAFAKVEVADGASELESISVEPESVEINPLQGDSKILDVTYNPSSVPPNQRGVVWSSSDETIATVMESGIVQAGLKGECTVTATSVYNTSISDSAKVKVLESALIDIKAPVSWWVDDGSYMNTEKESPAVGNYIWTAAVVEFVIKPGETKEDAIIKAAYSTVASVTNEDYIVPEGSDVPYFRSRGEENKITGYTTIPVYPHFIYGKGDRKPTEAILWTSNVDSFAKVGRIFSKSKYPGGEASDEEKQEYSTKSCEIEGNPNADRLTSESGVENDVTYISKSSIGGTDAVPFTLLHWYEQSADGKSQSESLPVSPYGYLVKTGNSTTIYNPDEEGLPGYTGEKYIELKTYDGEYTLWCSDAWYIGREHGCLRGKPSYVPIVEDYPEYGHRIEPRDTFTYKNDNGDDVPLEQGHTWIERISDGVLPIKHEGRILGGAPDYEGNVFEPEEYSPWRKSSGMLDDGSAKIIYASVKNESVGGKYGTIDEQSLVFNELGTIGKTGNAIYYIDSAKGDRGYTTQTIKTDDEE